MMKIVRVPVIKCSECAHEAKYWLVNDDKTVKTPYCADHLSARLEKSAQKRKLFAKTSETRA